MNAALPTTAIAGPWDLPLGTPVVDRLGDSLGRVVDPDAAELLVRRGWVLPPTHVVPWEHVARYEDGALWLDVSRAELAQLG